MALLLFLGGLSGFLFFSLELSLFSLNLLSSLGLEESLLSELLIVGLFNDLCLFLLFWNPLSERMLEVRSGMIIRILIDSGVIPGSRVIILTLIITALSKRMWIVLIQLLFLHI